MCRGPESQCAADPTADETRHPDVKQRWSEMEEECIEGSEAPNVTDSSCQSLSQAELEDSNPSWQPLPVEDQETMPSWQPLPALALKSRLRGHATAPTWAAWLPPSLQPAAYTGAAQTFDVNAEASTCQDALQIMPANGDAFQATTWDTFQPTTWVAEDGIVYQTVFVPMENFVNPGDACTFYDGGHLEYTQFDEPAQEEPRSVGPLAGRVWKLSQDDAGCRRVQDAFDEANDEERTALATELKGHVWQALKCGHANHVIQKCITTMRPTNTQFIIDELTHYGTGGAASAARHRFGCRIIERLLEHCPAEQVAPMVEELLSDTVALSDHVYGYYVVQHLLEHCGSDVVTRISSILEQHLSAFNAGGYAGAVLAKALTQVSNTDSQSLATALLKDPERLSIMACSRWGSDAVLEALQRADATSCNKACEGLLWYTGKLRSNRYGRHVAALVAENTSTPWPNYSSNKASGNGQHSSQKVSNKLVVSASKHRCIVNAKLNPRMQHFAATAVACN